MPITSIKKGESFDYTFDLNGDSTDGWTCTVNLKQYPDDETLINRTLTAKDDKWTGTLSSNDTKDLNIGQYLVIGNLSKANEETQDITRFYVSKRW